MMDVQLIEPGDERWSQLLAGTQHDFYHLPAYCDLAAHEDGGEALALYVVDGDHRLLLPLVRRSIEGGGVDVASPYGYPGPLVAPTPDSRFLHRALAAGVQLLEAEGYVSLFVRMHPILSPRPPIGIGTIVHHPPTVVVDLERPDEDWLSGMRKSHRQQIARALDAGHRAYLDEGWGHYDRFKQLYRGTMERLGAGSSYHFSDAYFDDLRRALDGSLKLCVIERDGRVWAGGLFVETNGIVESHLSGDDGSHRRGGAKKLMYAHVRDWAKARGDRWLHLGGGGPSPGLMSFKTGFSRERRPFDTLRVVLRPDVYQCLVATRGCGGDATDRSGFFPAYRHAG